MSQELHARFGGDEFCFLIPELDHFSDARGSSPSASAKRSSASTGRIEDARLSRNRCKVDVGVVCLHARNVTERRHIARQLAHDLLARADKLMYEAKGERATHVYPLRVRIEHGQLVELASDEFPE